ncbi:MAG: type II toxin-antitoxin system RelE/ParE family toxin [bacterium]|nr:type II toxin-antitoxin system RelE/ParE family toxin [bacterium]
MTYSFRPLALKQLEKLPKNVQKGIIKKLDFYCLQKAPLKFTEHLIDKRLGSYRFRIGEYRVVFDVEENQIIIILIGHRREIYR